MKNLIFFGNAPGKFIDDFITINNELFIKNDIIIHRYLNHDSFISSFNNSEINLKLKSIIVLLYCEDIEQTNRNRYHKANYSEVIKFESDIPKYFINYQILHNTKLGEILGEKIKTNNLFSKNGILCPPIINEFSDGTSVFQNEMSRSGGLIKIITSKSDFDKTKYNTEFIDSTYRYNGEKYYTTIRFLCVGEVICSIKIGFRNVKENNPSVHSRTTPLNPELINSYYLNHIKSRMKDFELICNKIFNILGLGFYAHDFILSENGDIYLLESMFKAHNRIWFNHTESISDKLVLLSNTNEELFNKMGQAFISKIREGG